MLNEARADQLKLFHLLLKEFQRRKREARLYFWLPWGKQKEFISASKKYWELALFGGNQSGKTEAGALVCAVHALGCYDELPFKWHGRRFDEPVRILVIGNQRDQMRAACQAKLMGEPGQWGTGMIPKSAITHKFPGSYIKDANDCLDQVWVKWKGSDDELSIITYKTQKQAEEAIMGARYHIIWWDEMPQDASYFMQSVARLTMTNGLLIATATPEKGVTDIALRFVNDHEDKRWWGKISTAQNPYVPEAVRKDLYNRYPPHLWGIKIEGDPMALEGLIFPLNREDITCAPLDLRRGSNFEYIAGLDLGFSNSYTAIVWLAYDRDFDMTYVFDAEKVRQEVPETIKPRIQKWDQVLGFDARYGNMGVPVAWPLDALHKQRSYGNVIKDEYTELGVNMIDRYAGFSDERKNNVDSGNWALLRGFQSGKLKVVYQDMEVELGKMKKRFPDADEALLRSRLEREGVRSVKGLEPLLKELETYHKKDGEIHKTDECQFDFIDALRYAHTMLLEGYAEKPMIGRESREWREREQADIQYDIWRKVA